MADEDTIHSGVREFALQHSYRFALAEARRRITEFPDGFARGDQHPNRP
jgi:hypothetical protein